MTFLNASLLAGALAVAVPIYLHLTGRRQSTQIVFGSLFLLQRTVQTTQAKVRIQRWWLLAIRVLALLALAFGLAGPAIAGASLGGMTWSLLAMAVGAAAIVAATIIMLVRRARHVALPLAIVGVITILVGGVGSAYAIASGPEIAIADGPVSLALVIDNGPTSARRMGDEDQLSRYRRDAASLLSNLPTGSRVAVLDRSGIAATLAADSATASTRVQSVETIDFAVPIGEVIAAAERLVKPSAVGSPQIVVLSDHSAATWATDASTENLNPVLNAESDQSLDDNDKDNNDKDDDDDNDSSDGVAVQIIARPPVGLQQFALSIPTITPAFPPPMTTSSIAVTVSSQRIGDVDDGGTKSVTVELQMYADDPSRPVLMDGELVLPSLSPIDRRLVQLASGQSDEVVLEIPPLLVGTHHGTVRVVNTDDFDRDNVRYFTVNVLPAGEVLLISDEPEEAFVLEQTLAELSGPITTITSKDISLVRLEDYRAVVLMDPSRSTLASEGLTKWVAGGGNWMVLLGPSCEPQGRFELPAWMPGLERMWRVPEPGTFLQISAANHPITRSIDGDTPWSGFLVNQYWRVSAPPDQDWTMRTLMQYVNTNHPALVEIRDGESVPRGLVWTTPLPALLPPASKWNDLFGTDPWPIWLTLRACGEQLVRGDRSNRNLTAGQSLIVPRSELIASVEEARVQWFVPSASAAIPVDVAEIGAGSGFGSGDVVFGPLRERGIHWVRGSDLPTGMSVNVPMRQTSLELVESSEIQSQLERRFGGEVSVLNSPDELRFTGDSSRQPTPISGPLLVLAAIALVAEQWIVGKR